MSDAGIADRVDAIVFCDDVRREFTGKDIIIGTYTGSITLPNFPQQNIRVCCWFQYTPKHGGNIDLVVRYGFSSQKGEFLISFGAEQGGQPVAIFTFPFFFTVLERGKLQLSLSEDRGQSFVLVKEIDVIDLAGAMPSPPPSSE